MADADAAAAAAVAAPHACQDCHLSFSRLDHLKRHAASLHAHIQPKLHECEQCGKRFGRKDVLTRHHVSCAAMRVFSERGEPPVKRARRSSPGAGSANHTVPGDNSPGSDTIQVFDGRRQSLVAQSSPGLPSPPDSHGGQNQAASLMGDEAAVMPSYVPSLDHIHVANSDNATGSDRRSADPGAQCTDPNATSGPQVVGDQAGDPVVVTARPRNTASKRGRYVSNACLSCQQRKIKCSGDQPCLQCVAAERDCVYTDDRRRRGNTSTRNQKNGAQAHTRQAAAQSGTNNETQALLSTLKRLTDRLSVLEREHWSTTGPRDNHLQNGDTGADWDNGSGDSSVVEEDDNFLPNTTHGDAGTAQTSLQQAIAVLNHRCSKEIAETLGTDLDGNHQRDATTWSAMPSAGGEDLRRLMKDTRALNVAEVEQCVQTYFTLINPTHPCLHESTFRAQHAKFFAAEPVPMIAAERYQVAVQTNLVVAVVNILTSDSTDSRRVPGWRAFCRAEGIMHHLMWLGNGDSMTLQCLIIKAIYLLCVERADGAYDTMSRAVHLCFRLGFHNQPVWPHLSETETVMRQRIFWTMVVLERSVAFHCGAPYLTRETDCRVDFPAAIEDKSMVAGAPLPAESPLTSCSLYLAGAARWSLLSAQVWDKLYAVNAAERRNLEAIAAMDARILYNVSTLAPHLQWSEEYFDANDDASLPSTARRQRMMLYLQMNYLRLLLRQESMLTADDDQGTTASECLAIASSSINTLHAYLNSAEAEAVDRFPACSFLVRSLLVLACIIFSRWEAEMVIHSEAVEGFNKGHALLAQMAPSFGNARHALRRLDGISARVERVARRTEHDDGRHDSGAVGGGLPQHDAMHFGYAENAGEPSAFPQPISDLTWQPGSGLLMDGLVATGAGDVPFDAHFDPHEFRFMLA